MSDEFSHTNYYVDEAGDGTIFNKRGKVIIGDNGVSQYFIMGLLQIPDPIQLSVKLEKLRTDLLADTYFKQVPSMQPKARKTALAFHAKDDVAEVRREVFKLLRQEEGLKFFAVVKSKKAQLEYIRSREKVDNTYKYHPNELYDHLVKRLFKNRLHKSENYTICFSRRGNSKRTKALRDALEIAQNRSNVKASVKGKSLMKIESLSPTQQSGLQAVDYFLWALQRLYERREDRYLEYIWSSCSLIIDIDDVRDKPYGMYYSQREPLTVASLEKI